MNRPSIIDVIAEHSARLLAIDGVVGMAEGSHEGRPCVQIHLARDDETVRASLPEELDGYPVVTIVTGEAELL